MRQVLYLAGRALQIMGLIALPSSLWVGFMGHDESASIAIFAGSLLVFYLGYFLSSFGIKR
ncbi:MAG TPA: hypothetical protein VL688_09445 [Verrucomicrobiae bacterium]|nr:hypothetical protein [Verrucomicrobiae bacterium]